MELLPGQVQVVQGDTSLGARPLPALAPFKAEQARAYQEAWAKHLGVPVELTNTIGMKFQLIPPGEFTMGMTKEEAEAAAQIEEQYRHFPLSSAPAHRVRLIQAYYLGTYEVTQEQYEKVTGGDPAHFSATGSGKDSVANENPRQHPVEQVSYIDAAEFCIKLNKKEQLQSVYSSENNVITLLPGDCYRLPTEVEWEWACRAGTTTPWSHGEQESELATVAWYNANADDRTPGISETRIRDRIRSARNLPILGGSMTCWATSGKCVRGRWAAAAVTTTPESAVAPPPAATPGAAATAVFAC